MNKRMAAILAAAAFALAIAAPARADDAIRVSNAAPASLYFVGLQLGIDQGIFKKHGLDVTALDFAGPAKSQAAMIGGAVDFELGSGTEMAYIAKGAKELSVATVVEPPSLVDVIVRKDSPYKTLADLKGKTISIISAGSLTEWLAKEIANKEGWGPGGVTVLAVGSAPAQVAMLTTSQVDASIVDTSAANVLVDKGQARILANGSAIAPNFITHSIQASQAIIDAKPDVVKRFVAAWFDVEEYMLTHKTETVAAVAAKLGVPADIAGTDYDQLIHDFSRTGKFPAAGLKVLAGSFVTLGILPAEPDMSTLYTERFLPPPIK